MGCSCQMCGEKFTVDLMVPDDLWEVVKPEGTAKGAGLLCGSCIMRRIEQVSGFDAWRLVNINRESQPVLED